MSDVARNIELVERLKGTYNERDYDTVRACLEPDFVVYDIMGTIGQLDLLPARPQ